MDEKMTATRFDGKSQFYSRLRTYANCERGFITSSHMCLKRYAKLLSFSKIKNKNMTLSYENNVLSHEIITLIPVNMTPSHKILNQNNGFLVSMAVTFSNASANISSQSKHPVRSAAFSVS